MKVKTNTPDELFIPVTIEITLETQSELDGLARVFNHSVIINAFEAAGINNTHNISSIAKSAGAELYSIKWDDFEGIINKVIKRKN